MKFRQNINQRFKDWRSQILIRINWWYSNPSISNKLDVVLSYLNHDRDEADVFDDILNHCREKGIFLADTHRCLNQLIVDNYVGELNTNKVQLAPLNITYDGKNGNIKPIANSITAYYITVSGKRLIENGGYAKLKWKFWLKKEFWSDTIFKVLTITFASLSIYLTYINSKSNQFEKQTIERISTLEGKIEILSNSKQKIEYNYFSSDTIKRDSIE